MHGKMVLAVAPLVFFCLLALWQSFAGAGLWQIALSKGMLHVCGGLVPNCADKALILEES